MIIEQEITMPNDGQNVNVNQKVDSGQGLVVLQQMLFKMHQQHNLQPNTLKICQ